MRTLIIHNPMSGLRTDDIFAFQRALLEPGDEAVMRITQPHTNPAFLVSDASQFDAVVVSGGDGTIADVAYAMHKLDIPLLIFPSGTANLLANNIGNASEPLALANTLRHGQRVDIDMCEFTYTNRDGEECHHGFLSMAGAGYDANLMQGSAGLKQFFGQFSYYLAALGNLDPGVSHMKLTIDDQVIEAEGICVLVGNWAVVNQTMEIIPASTPLDGLLDVAVVTAKHSVELLPTVISSLFSHGDESRFANVTLYRAHEVTVECEPEFPLQYDGEVVVDATTPFSARVLPGGLHTVVDSFSPLARLAPSV